MASLVAILAERYCQCIRALPSRRSAFKDVMGIAWARCAANSTWQLLDGGNMALSEINSAHSESSICTGSDHFQHCPDKTRRRASRLAFSGENQRSKIAACCSIWNSMFIPRTQKELHPSTNARRSQDGAKGTGPRVGREETQLPWRGTAQNHVGRPWRSRCSWV